VNQLFKRNWGKLTIGSVIVIPIVLFTLWTMFALHYSYSSGDRAGYVQKLSKRGWLCKTWEGELIQTPIPGAAPEKFLFSVRSDSIAAAINKMLGKQVALTYAQHKHVPTSCFGETEYYVDAVRLVQ
jgi:hypothetical protein